MKVISDKALLECYFAEQQAHFRQRPSTYKLVEFEKGELVNSPMKPLKHFFIIVRGGVSIYDLTEDGGIRYITKSGPGTLLGDMEFSGEYRQLFYAEAAEATLCIAIPFRENQNVLKNDPVFLRFVLEQLAKKLSCSAILDASSQTLEEKVLFYLRIVQPDHAISSITEALQPLHCSRRQLQRVVKKLCDEKVLVKTGKGHYRLGE